MDQKRLFLAIAISVAILLGFQYLMPHPPAPVHPPGTVEQTQGGQTLGGQTQGGVAPSGQPQVGAAPSAVGAPGAGEAAKPAAVANAVPKTVPRVAIDAPRVAGSISLLGARIDDLSLK